MTGPRTTQSELEQLAEQIGRHFENLGLSRTAGRTLGRLAVTSRDLTAAELTTTLGVAKSSMSVTLSTLTRYGLVTRHPVGARSDAYRLADRAFEGVFTSKLGELEIFPALAERGLELSDDPLVRERLTGIRDYYRFMLREFPQLLARWDQERDRDD